MIAPSGDIAPTTGPPFWRDSPVWALGAMTLQGGSAPGRARRHDERLEAAEHVGGTARQLVHLASVPARASLQARVCEDVTGAPGVDQDEVLEPR